MLKKLYRLGLLLGLVSVVMIGQAEINSDGWDPVSPPDPDEPHLAHVMILKSDPENACGFNYNARTRIFEDQTVGVTAYPSAGFKLVNMTIGDEVVTTDSYYEFTMGKENVEIVAHVVYDPDDAPDPTVMPYQHTVRVSSYPKDAGEFSIYGDNLHYYGNVCRVDAGGQVKIYGAGRTGFKLDYWTVNGERVEADGNYITVNVENVSLDVVGYFHYDPASPANPAANYWNPETGELIMDDFTPGNLEYAIYSKLGNTWDWSAVTSLKVRGKASENDLYCATHYFPNVETVDLSRMGGVSVLPPYSFENAPVKELSLPSSIKKVQWCQFYESTVLSRLTIYAFVPPVADPDAFWYFKNQKNCVLYVPASSVALYEAAEGWKDFYEIRPIVDDVATLNVCLPDEATDGRYKNYRLELVNTNTDASQKFVITDRIKYTFNGMLPDEVYDAFLYTPSGIEVASIKDIAIVKPEKDQPAQTVTFTDIKAVYTATAVVTADGADVTAQTTIEWYGDDAKLLRKGATLPETIEGQALTCRIALPEALGTAYATPADQTVTVGNADTTLEFALKPFAPMTFTGTVLNENKEPMNGAAVSLVQTLNGKYNKSFTATTDLQGQWSINAYSTTAALSYAADEYVTQNSSIEAADADETSCGTIVLKPIDGCRIQYGFTYTPATLPGIEPETQPLYDDYKNVVISLYNQTQDCPQENISQQYPQVVILDSNVEVGDIILVTATSKSGAFDPITVSTVIDDNNTGKVTIPVVGRGAIKASYEESETEEVNAFLHNADGKFVDKVAYNNNKAAFSDLADGEYTLITIAKSDYIDYQQNVTDYQEMGLTDGKDYVVTPVTVSKGVITTTKIDNVPALNEQKLFYTDINRTSILANKPEITVGNYLTLRAQMDFQEKYLTSIDNVVLRVDLPDGVAMVPGSLMIGNAISSYQLDGNRVIVPMGSRFRELVKFCVVPTESGTANFAASVAFDYQKEPKAQPIGNTQAKVNELQMRIPGLIAKPTFTATGQGRAQSQVEVYEGSKRIGQGKVNAAGEWSVNCDLGDGIYNLSHHSIHAEVKYTVDGTDYYLKSEVKDCVYDQNAIQVNKVTMYHYNPEFNKTFTSEFDFQNPKTVPTQWTVYYPKKHFTYTVDFSNNHPDFVHHVRLHVKTGGGEWIEYAPAYDKKRDIWVLDLDMGSSPDGKYPVNVSMSYSAKSQAMIDGLQLEDLYNEIMEFIRSMQAGADATDEAISAVESQAGQTNPDYSAIRDKLADVNNADLEYDHAIADKWNGMNEAEIATAVTELTAQAEVMIKEAKDNYTDMDRWFYRYVPDYKYSVDGITGKKNTITVSKGVDVDADKLLSEDYKLINVSLGNTILEYNDATTYDKQDKARCRKFNIVPADGNTIELPKWHDAYAQTQAYFNKTLKEGAEYSEHLSGLYTGISANRSSLMAVLEKVESELIAAYDVEQKRLAAGNADAASNLRNIAAALIKVEATRSLMNRTARFSANLSKVGAAMHDRTAWVKRIIDLGPRLDALDVPTCNILDEDSVKRLIKRIDDIRADYYLYYGKHVGRYGQITLDGTLKTVLDACNYVMRFLDQRGEMLRDEQFTRDFESELVSIERTLASIRRQCEDHRYDVDGPGEFDSGSPDDIVQIDPSGYVYEGVEDNRVEGVEATIYQKLTTKNDYDEDVETILEWDAENYGQENPLYTDENGMYRWDVPEGLWQVKFEKDGYETAYSDWLPVPPPQLDVNVGIVQNAQPEVAEVHAYTDGVEMIFDKYMTAETFSGHIYVQNNNGVLVDGAPETGNQEFVKSVYYKFEEPLSEKVTEITAIATSDVKSYAGIALETYMQTISLEVRVDDIELTMGKDVVEALELNSGRNQTISVKVLPVEAGAGKTLVVSSSALSIVTVGRDADKVEVTLNSKGEGTFTVKGELPGQTELALSVNGSTYKENVEVTVVQSEAEDVLLGDSNDDGTVNVTDVVTTIDFILGNSPAKFNQEAADANVDGIINVTDVVTTIDFILNDHPSANYLKAPYSITEAESFVADALSIRAGETSTLDVALTNATDYASMQMDVLMPEGLTLVGVEMAEGNANHTAAWREGANARVVVASMSNRNFSDDTIVRLTVKADDTFVPGSGDIILHSGIVTERTGDDIDSYAVSAVYIGTNGASGIASSLIEGLKVRVDGRNVYVDSPVDTTLVLSDMLGRGMRLDVRSGANAYTVGAPGVYMLAGQKLVIR